MLPSVRLRLGSRVWSRSCVELEVRRVELGGYVESEGRRSASGEEGSLGRRASADSLESGYATLSLSDCDPEPAGLPASPYDSPPHSQHPSLPHSQHPSLPHSQHPSPPHKPQRESVSGGRRLSRAQSMRQSLRSWSGRAHHRRRASSRSGRGGFGRTQSVSTSSTGSSCTGSSTGSRRDSVVHWKAKVCSKSATIVITIVITRVLGRNCCEKECVLAKHEMYPHIYTNTPTLTHGHTLTHTHAWTCTHLHSC